MKEAEIPDNETERLIALRSLNILDTLPEERFDRITRLAMRLFNVPICVLTFVDSTTNFHKSIRGLDGTPELITYAPRDVSFCGHVVANEGETLVIPDTHLDERFKDNPNVTKAPHFRFYAGHPIKGSTEYDVGTFCIIDQKPRTFTEDELEALADLTAIVEREISLLNTSTLDELTQISNRRGFNMISSYIVDLCKRSLQPVVLASIDVDKFKLINDTAGHEAGDQALIDISNMLVEHFRSADVIARVGGDEFVVMAVGTSISSIGVAFDSLIQKFMKSELRKQYPFLGLSIGYANLNLELEDPIPDALKIADQQMYDIKQQHRNFFN